jgi:hypothetical protein
VYIRAAAVAPVRKIARPVRRSLRVSGAIGKQGIVGRV